MPYTEISLWRGNLAVTNFASHRDTAASKTSSTSSTPPFEQPEFSPEARPSQSMYMEHYPGQDKTSSTSSTPPFEQPEFSPEARPSQSMYMEHYPGQDKTSSTSSTPPFEQPEFSPEARPSQSMYMAHYPGQEVVPHAGKRFLCCLYREWIPLLVDILQ